MIYQHELNRFLDEVSTQHQSLTHAQQLSRIETLLGLGAKLDYYRLYHCPAQLFQYYFGRLHQHERNATEILARISQEKPLLEIKQFIYEWRMDPSFKGRANIPMIFHVLSREKEVVEDIFLWLSQDYPELKSGVLEYVINTGLWVERVWLLKFLVYQFGSEKQGDLTYKLAHNIMQKNLKFSDYLPLFVCLDS